MNIKKDKYKRLKENLNHMLKRKKFEMIDITTENLINELDMCEIKIDPRLMYIAADSLRANINSWTGFIGVTETKENAIMIFSEALVATPMNSLFLTIVSEKEIEGIHLYENNYNNQDIVNFKVTESDEIEETVTKSRLQTVGGIQPYEKFMRKSEDGMEWGEKYKEKVEEDIEKSI